MQNKLLYLNIILLFVCGFEFTCKAQNQNISDELKNIIEADRYLRIMFYNCENLFDIYDDSLTNDNEFLPDGEKYWNKKKYNKKLNQISKIITTTGGWNPPEIIGLCEVENKKVLNDLIYNTQLYNAEYKIIHKNSPDKRGIDVALLYLPTKFKILKTSFIKINFPKENSRSTRDILYAKGIVKNTDTLHIFINHWPSKWGGELETEVKRMHVASILKTNTDSILRANSKAKIVLTGDFNDSPTNNSIRNVLMVKTDTNELNTTHLYNFSYIKYKNTNIGSHKHKGTWNILDQFIVSGSLLDSRNSINASRTCILDAGFLLHKDENYLGIKPYRTYNGYTYIGGFSDHLPIFIDLEKTRQD